MSTLTGGQQPRGAWSIDVLSWPHEAPAALLMQLSAGAAVENCELHPSGPVLKPTLRWCARQRVCALLRGTAVSTPALWLPVWRAPAAWYAGRSGNTSPVSSAEALLTSCAWPGRLTIPGWYDVAPAAAAACKGWPPAAVPVICILALCPLLVLLALTSCCNDVLLAMCCASVTAAFEQSRGPCRISSHNITVYQWREWDAG